MPPAPSSRTGVLLLNVGSPDAPDTRAVRRYLREFLGDPRMLDMAAPLRWLLLNAVILPFRPRRAAHAYRQVWSEAGPPLRVHTESLRLALARALGDAYVVTAGMRYGRPSLAAALQELHAQDVARIVLFPLFPQYAASSTGSALEACFAEIGRRWNVLPVTTIPPFFDDPGFIHALAAVARPELDAFKPEYVLLSYHGLPERHITRSDPSGAHCLSRADCCDAPVSASRHCYRAQCFATSRALVGALDLETERVGVSFQSRLGRTPWIRPFTDERLPELAQAGVRRLAVLCPSFVADCLETREEIAIRAREQWRSLGGEDLLCVPCVNASADWVSAARTLVLRSSGSS